MISKIILVGNPNVGKSLIFNRLTGQYAVVSNYPGTTVDVTRGELSVSGNKFEVIDTPGTISLLPDSQDEQVTREILFSEKDYVIVQVADAKNLLRTLLLTLELVELKVPMVLALNMSDEAREKGIHVNREILSSILGIDVVETVATTGDGIKKLKNSLLFARTPSFDVQCPPALEKLCGSIAPALKTLPLGGSIARMLVSGDESVYMYVPENLRPGLKEQLRSFSFHEPRRIFLDHNTDLAAGIVKQALPDVKDKTTGLLTKLGNLSMRPFPGYLIALLALYAMYEFVGVFGAGVLVDWLGGVFETSINPVFIKASSMVFGAGLINDFLVGPYGVITMALTYAFSIILPIVAVFFIFFGLLEDSGYLPRLSAMLDRVFSLAGLNGKAVIPMVLGLGCGTMASLTSRILETKKERIMVVLLLSLAVPCSAQLGVTMGLLAGLSIKVFALWFLSIVFSLLVVGWAADRLTGGCRQPFLLEVPPLRIPNLNNMLLKVKMRIVWYLKEAVPLFVLGTAILFVLDRTGALVFIEEFLRPVMSGFLGLPKETAESFIMGFLRRDYGAAKLYEMARDGLLSPRQVLVSVVTITLFIPCVAQFFVVIKEHGVRTGILILGFVMAYAFVFGGMLNWFLKITNIV